MNQFQPRLLGDTVVGFLFAKTGKEIKEAVARRVDEISGEVQRLEGATKDVSAFVNDKEKELMALREFYQERSNDKVAAARPYQRQLDEVFKAWADTEFDFNKETDKLVGEKAVVFEDGFDKFQERFKEIDELAKELDQSKSVVRASSGVSGCLPGAYAGMQDGNLAIQPCAADMAEGQEYPERQQRARATNGTTGLPTQVDKAAARLNTLRRKVTDAQKKLVLIGGHIKVLKAEAESLSLVSMHLRDEEKYTLDFDSLVALGFETK